ncbi:VENN motif pre-toxin domain-containing protein, partial [Edwardsiella ictaluri]
AQHQGFGLSSGGSIGGQFAGNMANSLLAGANHQERARGTTQSAIADGAIVVRDRANQQQDVAGLARDTEQAHQPLSPIFDKEKAQRRLQQARLIGEIGNQVADIARTEGEIAGEKARRDPTALNQARTALEASGKPFTEKDVAQRAYNTGMRDSGFGTGGQYQQAIQAATAAVQGLAGGNLQAALAGGAAPYISEIIKQSTPDGAGRVAAHAVVNAALAAAQGNHPLAGAAGAASGEIVGMLATEIYQKPVAELSESEKQTVSTLATVAAGLAGGLVGDAGASALAGAQSGKTTVENNSLGTIAEALAAGKTLEQQAKEHVEAENEQYRKENCGGMNAEACSAKMYEQRREELTSILSTGADFVPVVGDIKSVAEAQSALDYLVAAIGIIPGAGDAAGKAVKAAEEALSKGDISEASKLINKASDEISAYNSATYPKLKDDLLQQNLNNIAKQDPRLEAVVKGDNRKLNYGVGNGTREEADKLGKMWVGDGAKPTSDGTGLMSADGTRVYRFPASKKDSPYATTGTQANFETFKIDPSTGNKVRIGNGHLDIE